MKAIRISCCILASLLAIPCSAALAEEERPAELKVLNRWVGEFDVVMTIKPGALVPNGSKSTVVVKSRWILNGRFVQSEGRGTRVQDGKEQQEEFLTLMTYDRRQKEYQNTILFAVHGGGADYWGGNFDTVGDNQWDESTKTMSFRAKHGKNGQTAEGFMRWTDNDHYEWQTTAKDADGNVVMEQSAKGVRRKNKE